MSRTKNWLLALVPALLITGVSITASAQDDDEMEFTEDDVETVKTVSAEPPPDTTPPSKTLERATKLYEKKNPDYDSASIEFAKVINGETEDSAANKQRAEFFMGKTLYGMGYYAASLAYFDRIVELGGLRRAETETRSAGAATYPHQPAPAAAGALAAAPVSSRFFAARPGVEYPAHCVGHITYAYRLSFPQPPPRINDCIKVPPHARRFFPILIFPHFTADRCLQFSFQERLPDTESHLFAARVQESAAGVGVPVSCFIKMQ